MIVQAKQARARQLKATSLLLILARKGKQMIMRAGIIPLRLTI